MKRLEQEFQGGDVIYFFLLILVFLIIGHLCMAGTPFKLENRLGDVTKNS